MDNPSHAAPLSLGTTIRNARKAHHLTLKQLARRIPRRDGQPISWRYLELIELDKAVPSEWVILHLAECLGLNSLQLLRLAGRATAQLATYLGQHPDQAGVLTMIFHQCGSGEPA